MPTEWKKIRPADAVWRTPKGITRKQAAAEQDAAAGGREMRRVRLPDGGTACGSVCLRLPPKSRRVYAYLRWSDRGKTSEAYICQVDGQTREENLTQAWRAAHDKDLIDQSVSPGKNDDSWASSPVVRSIMQGNKGRDTRPELALRSAVHRLGLRYRVGIRPVPELRRTADIVFPGRKVAVFLDGCFWHGCPDHHRPATRNSDFWTSKVEQNKARDADTDRRLSEHGWTVIRVWEHEDPQDAADRIANVIVSPRSEIAAAPSK
jgi:DNA mismatch endonuclease, patch repair protein